MAIISYKCPNCGGDLRFDPNSQQFRCEYCMSEFTREQMEAANPRAEDTVHETGMDGDAQRTSRENAGQRSGDLQQAYREDTEQKGGDARHAFRESTEQKAGDSDEANVYVCPSCGAEIVTDTTTAATFCFYCHNPVVLQGRLSGAYRPDQVIPFAIDKKKAVSEFLSCVHKKKFVPRAFFCKEQIEKISGVYFPFWVYGCHTETQWHGKGNRVRVRRIGDLERTETSVFQVERDAELSFERLTRNALNKDNRELVEAVQPFRMDGATAFSMGYLSGFQAEKRDIEKTDLEPEMQEEVRQHSREMVRSSISGYQTLEVSYANVTIDREKWEYLLLPVWVLTYQGGDGKTYYYAMNGQTGKVSGILPIDKKRVLALFFSIFFPVFMILLLGGYLIW